MGCQPGQVGEEQGRPYSHFACVRVMQITFGMGLIWFTGAYSLFLRSPAPGPATGPRCLGRVPGQPGPKRDLWVPERRVWLGRGWTAEGREIDRARRALRLVRLSLIGKIPSRPSSDAPLTPPKPKNGRGANGPASCGTLPCTSRIRRRWIGSFSGRVASMRAPLGSRGGWSGASLVQPFDRVCIELQMRGAHDFVELGGGSARPDRARYPRNPPP